MMKVLAVLLALVPLSMGQDVLFEDDFSDGNADGWDEMITGASYQVNTSLCYEMSYSGPDSVFAFSSRGDNGATMSESDYSVLVDVTSTSPTRTVGVHLRYMDGPGSCYSLYINFHLNSYYILRYDTFSSWTLLGSSVPYSGGFDYLTTYHMRFECLSDTRRGKIGSGSTAGEPGWMIVRVDGPFYNNGCMALETGNTSGTEFLTEFDNVLVTGFPIGLDGSTWGGIKNSF